MPYKGKGGSYLHPYRPGRPMAIREISPTMTPLHNLSDAEAEALLNPLLPELQCTPNLEGRLPYQELAGNVSGQTDAGRPH